VFCPYVDEQHEFCCSRPWQPSELRMALEGEVLDSYINSLVNYINSTTALQSSSNINNSAIINNNNNNSNNNHNNNHNNKNNNNNNNNNSINQVSSTVTSSSTTSSSSLLPIADEMKSLSPSIMQDLMETLNISCPQCNAVLDPSPDGCCSVR